VAQSRSALIEEREGPMDNRRFCLQNVWLAEGLSCKTFKGPNWAESEADLQEISIAGLTPAEAQRG
jgi:hypothetical protein